MSEEKLPQTKDLLNNIIADGEAVIRCLMPEDAVKIQRWCEARFIQRQKPEPRFKLSDIDPLLMSIFLVLGVFLIGISLTLFKKSPPPTDSPQVQLEWKEVWECEGRRINPITVFCSTDLVKAYEARISGYTCAAASDKPTSMTCVWTPP